MSATPEHGGREDGASATEYGLLIAGIAALVVGLVLVFGGFVTGLFTDTCDHISNTAGAPADCRS